MTSQRSTFNPAVSTDARSDPIVNRRCPGKPVAARRRETTQEIRVSSWQKVGANEDAVRSQHAGEGSECSFEIRDEVEYVRGHDGIKGPRLEREAVDVRLSALDVLQTSCGNPVKQTCHHRGGVIGGHHCASGSREHGGDEPSPSGDLKDPRATLRCLGDELEHSR